MLLSDRIIQRKIDEGAITVEPYPEPEQFQPASLDVRLSDELYNINTETHLTNVGGSVRLEPGVPYLGTTIETVGVPDTIAAYLTGRSTIARKGVAVHITAGWIDPGFEGQITMEMYNFSNHPVTLQAYDRVAQLAFFSMPVAASDGYDGQYQDQDGPTEAGDV